MFSESYIADSILWKISLGWGKGPVFFKSEYPVGVFFKGCEIFSEKFKGSENNLENI